MWPSLQVVCLRRSCATCVAGAAALSCEAFTVLHALQQIFHIFHRRVRPHVQFNWKGALPKWYMALRVPLTIGASGAMFLTMWHQAAAEEDDSRGHDESHAVAMA